MTTNEVGRVAAGVAVPGIASYVGMNIPIAPACIAMVCALLVRVTMFRRKTWIADTCWTFLSMIGAFATVVDHQFGPGAAFWLGLGFGATGSGLAEIGRNFVTSDIKERLQSAFRALGGVKE